MERHPCAEVREEETQVDRYEDALGTYLVKLSSRELNHADSQSVNTLLHTISDFERISDHSVNLMESAEEMHTKDIPVLAGCPRRAAGAGGCGAGYSEPHH